jgi:NADH-quinone oxidoreductase subunit J
MLNRLPLPAQMDRVIVIGGMLAILVATPVVGVLIALLVLDQITAPELVFWMVAGLIVAGALGAVLLSNLVHAALSLVGALIGVAGIYLLLGSEFLALVQLLVYGGGVTILLLFGVMLTRAADDPVVADGSQKPFALIIATLIGGIFVGAVLDATWSDAGASVVSIEDLGVRLFRDFGVPFEVASLVLLVALIGAIAIARSDDADDDADPTGEEEAAS